MTRISEFAIPVIMVFFALSVLTSKSDMHAVFANGVMRGFKTALDIAPTMIILLASIRMLNASGVTDWLTSLLSPIMSATGIPSEIVPLIVIRPVSGSGATAMVSEIFSKYGADSFAGRCASVLAGCTDTIVYTISVYFGAAGIKNTRHALPAAFLTQIFAVFISCLAVRIYFG